MSEQLSLPFPPLSLPFPPLSLPFPPAGYEPIYVVEEGNQLMFATQSGGVLARGYLGRHGTEVVLYYIATGVLPEPAIMLISNWAAPKEQTFPDERAVIEAMEAYRRLRSQEEQ